MSDKNPVSLAVAAERLREVYPEYAFSARTLREMCDARSIPCLLLPSKGMVRKCRYFVRVGQLVEFFKTKENKYA